MKTATRHQQALIRLDQIANQFTGIGVVSHRPDRHDHGQIGAASPGTIGAPAVLAALGAKPPGKTVIGQGIQFGVGPQVDTAAIAAIAAVGTAEGNVFLPPEADAAVAAVAGLDPDDDLIDEFHGVLCEPWTKQKPRTGLSTRSVKLGGTIAPAGCSRTCDCGDP